MNYKWELLSFDTDLLGFPVAKITEISTTPQTNIDKNIKLLVTELQTKNIHYATYRLNANNFTVIHALEQNNFLLIDSIVAMNIKKYDVLEKNTHIQMASLSHLSELKKIAGTIFKYNRFFNDPIIPHNKANEVYSLWIENSLLGKAAVLVNIWVEDEQILGFITLQRNGHIPLVAVSKHAQGKGISRKLIENAFGQFQSWGVNEITIETQLSNIPALRSYQNCGFKIIDSFMTFRWYNE